MSAPAILIHDALAVSDRVCLRIPTMNDVSGILALAADPDFADMSGLPTPFTLRHAEAYVSRAQDMPHRGAGVILAIVVDGLYCGTLDFHFGDGNVATIGCAVLPKVRRQGVTSSAFRTAVRWLFENTHIRSLHCEIEDSNHASIQLATRCGFTLAGPVPDLVSRGGSRHPGWRGTLSA